MSTAGSGASRRRASHGSPDHRRCRRSNCLPDSNPDSGDRGRGHSWSRTTGGDRFRGTAPVADTTASGWDPTPPSLPARPGQDRPHGHPPADRACSYRPPLTQCRHRLSTAAGNPAIPLAAGRGASATCYRPARIVRKLVVSVVRSLRFVNDPLDR